MKIAVTYDNGQIFQHFGRTEQFKVYTVEDGKVVSSEVIGSNGIGHGALAGLLAEQDIQVLICGGLGGGALNALTNAGIDVLAGAEGDTDAAVEAYLSGYLESTGANCDHHGEDHHCGHHDHDDSECCGRLGEGDDGECCGRHGEGEDCCGGDDSECCCGENDDCGGEGEDGGCCGGGGCCGAQANWIEGRNVGRTVRVHYRGTFDDGTQFDSSYDRGEPLEFTCGAGMMIPGFDRAVADMEVGQVLDAHLMPEEAYGMPDPGRIFRINLTQLPGAEQLNIGERVYLSSGIGQPPFGVTVLAMDDETITLDANHEMAGKELNFRIELVEVL